MASLMFGNALSKFTVVTGCFAAIVLTTCRGFADDCFVVLPDAANSRLVQLKASPGESGIHFDTVASRPVPFAPKSIAVNPSRRQFILTNGSSQKPQALTVSFLQGKQNSVHQVVDLPHPSGYTSFDRSGQYFLSAHYQSGTIACYRLQDDGSVGDCVQSIRTPNPAAHCIQTTRSNDSFYVPCVKQHNALFQYSFDADTGRMSAQTPLDAKPPAMFGPRHVAYHPTLPIAYFSNEQQLGVSVYRIEENGQLSGLQHATTMPRRSAYEQGKRDLHASDLAVSSDGSRLYVAVRDFEGDEDSVFSFEVAEDGRLNLLSRTLVGDIPWKIALSPADDVLFVSETGDERLAAYRIQERGALANRSTWSTPIQTRDFVVVDDLTAKQ